MQLTVQDITFAFTGTAEASGDTLATVRGPGVDARIEIDGGYGLRLTGELIIDDAADESTELDEHLDTARDQVAQISSEDHLLDAASARDQHAFSAMRATDALILSDVADFADAIAHETVTLLDTVRAGA